MPHVEPTPPKCCCENKLWGWGWGCGCVNKGPDYEDVDALFCGNASMYKNSKATTYFEGSSALIYTSVDDAICGSGFNTNVLALNCDPYLDPCDNVMEHYQQHCVTGCEEPDDFAERCNIGCDFGPGEPDNVCETCGVFDQYEGPPEISYNE